MTEHVFLAEIHFGFSYDALMYRSFNVSLLAICIFVAGPASSFAQTATPPSEDTSSKEALLGQLTTLRDSFVSQVKAEGFQPSLPPPTIVLDNPPSYGRYEDDKNLLHIAAWAALAPEDQARFSRVAAMLGGGQTGEQTFDDGVHHWVFVHELSHWWQACQHKTGENHYSVEYGANRIAAAYWRLKDPAFMERTAKRMATVYEAMPNPIPEGQSPQTYFNENYEKLGPTPAYRWYQYSMVLKIQAEKPPPALLQTLQHPTY
jgi:hypothetical protein